MDAPEDKWLINIKINDLINNFIIEIVHNDSSWIIIFNMRRRFLKLIPLFLFAYKGVRNTCLVDSNSELDQ